MHSEWSWDARAGSMELTCRRAAELGLPSIAFTEHADYTPWTIPAAPAGRAHAATGEGVLHPPGLDVAGYHPRAFEEEYREVLRALADSSRALEVNTEVPLHPLVVHWWHDVGGQAVAFGSDAHEPADLARRFAEAAAMAEANGFAPGNDPHDLWARA